MFPKLNNDLCLARRAAIYLSLLLFCLQGHAIESPLSGLAPTTSKFVVYDATLFTNKPDLRKYGIRPAGIIYQSGFWQKSSPLNEVPPPVSVSLVGQDFCNKYDLVILDVEQWPLKGSDKTVAESLNKYIGLIDSLKAKVKGCSVSYYGLPVGRDYWRAIGKAGSPEYKQWQAENDLLKPLAGHVDIAMPSLYTFYSNEQAWERYAIANIQEARRINPGKPVYPFLWPSYHDSNKLLGLTPIPADFWRFQLQTVKKYADGVILWSLKEPWDDKAPWWGVTKEFMETLK